MTANKQANTLQRRASDPQASAWVNANAGSGKTHVLIDRLIRLMLVGTEPSRILCLTFTKAAAAEMSTRLFDRLSSWIMLQDNELETALASIGVETPPPALLRRARQLFTSALETPGGLKIQTIHAFCERLLQLFPVEAGIVPHFVVMDERTAREALQAAREHVLQAARREPDGVLGTTLSDIIRYVQADSFDELLEVILKERASLDAYTGSADGIGRAVGELRRHFGLETGEDEPRVLTDLVLAQEIYKRLIAALEAGNANDRERGGMLAGVLATDEADLTQLREFYLTGAGEARKLSGMATKPVVAAHAWISDFLAAEQKRLIEGLGKLADLRRIAATASLLTLASAIIIAFEGEKRRRGAYDFDDLIIRTNRLLADRPDAAWVLYKLDGGIEHVLLDEAQDTSPAQWEIIRTLTAEFFAGEGTRGALVRTLFAVGDRKQSIYSFQGADPDIFEIVHDDFKQRILGAGQVFSDVDFTVSFRSTPVILEAVDIVFQQDSVARQGLDGRASKLLQHQANRRNEPGTVEIWPMTEPEDREEDQPWQAPVDREPANSPRRRLALHIARQVSSWIGRRRIQALNRAVQPADILILVRVRNSFFDALVRELRKAGIAVAGADRLTLVENIAVLDLLALARFCLLDTDDYSLACLLKTPLMPEVLSEDQIFDLAWTRGKRTLWQMMQESSDPQCVAAVQQLAHWREQARTARPFEFFASVLGITRKRILSRLGGEAKDALDAFLDSALDYEGENSSSLQGFVQWFASGDVEIKRNMEQGANEVRIMTVHGAKGLEAPIVILPDTVSMPDGKTQSALMMIEIGNAGGKLPLWRLPKTFESPGIAAVKATEKEDRDHEYRRLLYVAMTRARDELYICGYRGKKEAADGCWYNLVSSALKPVMREIGEGSGWRMGADPVLEGDVAAMAASNAVVIPDWVTRPAPAEPQAQAWSAPSHLGARDLSGLSGEGRQLRLERGVLMHRILQLLPDIAPADRDVFIARTVAKAGYDEAVSSELKALIAVPEFAALLAGDGLSEVPIMARILKQGRTISGRIDRLLLRENEIVAVDYKTDREWPASLDAVPPEYLLQMAAYRLALQNIHPGQIVRCVMVWTAGRMVMELPGSLLAETLNHNAVAYP